MCIKKNFPASPDGLLTGIWDIIRPLVHMDVFSLFLNHDHLVEPKAENRKIPFLITKRGQKLNSIRFSDPQPRNCGLFDLLFLIHDQPHQQVKVQNLAKHEQIFDKNHVLLQKFNFLRI